MKEKKILDILMDDDVMVVKKDGDKEEMNEGRNFEENVEGKGTSLYEFEQFGQDVKVRVIDIAIITIAVLLAVLLYYYLFL